MEDGARAPALLRRDARLGQLRVHRRLRYFQRVPHIGRIMRERDVELALALKDATLAETTIEAAAASRRLHAASRGNRRYRRWHR